MLRYMRSSEPKGNGDANDGNGGPGSPKTSSQLVTQPSLPPSVLTTRQQLAEAAKLPLPGATKRSATPGPPIHMFLAGAASPKQPPLRRARSNSDTRAPSEQQIWEESSINSMFAESVTTAPRVQRTGRGRYGGAFPPQRTQPTYERTAGERAEEDSGGLFAGERGIRKMLPPNVGETAIGVEDPYLERSLYGSPTRHVPVLKHSKYALRDSRVVTQRPTFLERTVNGGSPERRVRLREESVANDAEDPTLFRGTETPLARSPQRAEPEGGSDVISQGEDLTIQQTPRQHRLAQSSPKKLLESSVSRPGASSGRHNKKANHKRQHSPDYDDSMLHAMSYAELKDEPFDHDPTRDAVQQAAATPPRLSLEERLARHKNKETKSQQQFFTDMSAQEWDECGDWFLSQFSELTTRIREQRQAKRKMVAEFEAEIADRENMVRAKMESIERTLGALKQEGEGMMRGKVTDI